RHAAVLHGEEREQEGVDGERGPETAWRAGVDRLRYEQIAREADGVEEGAEEERVSDQAVEEEEGPSHDGPPVGGYDVATGGVPQRAWGASSPDRHVRAARRSSRPPCARRRSRRRGSGPRGPSPSRSPPRSPRASRSRSPSSVPRRSAG